MREVAVGILFRDGLILACQRKASANYGLKWEFPGGKLEPGESPREALDRELQEELAIRVKTARPFHRQEWTYPESAAGSNDGTFRVHYFLVDAFDGEPINRAFADFRWVTVAELSTLDILEGNRDAIAVFDRTMNGGHARR